MRKILLAFVLVSTISICSGQSIIDSLKTKAKNNQIPEKWNRKLFDYDKERLKNEKLEPLTHSAFPVSDYEYSVFNSPFNFKIADSHFSGISFGENTGGKENKMIFKHEITLIFYTGNKDYQLNGYVGSRNAPYLTVQGQANLDNLYEYIGIKSPDDTGFLIVNLKSFDLRFGQTIIIFPNKNNSFYYLQLNEEPSIGQKMEDFVSKIKTNSQIQDMLKLVDK